MREILFRGKRLDDGEWVYGDLKQTGIIHKFSIVYKDEDYLHVRVVDPETVGQFTGLKGMSNRKIFEGDIIVNSEYTGVVKYSEEDAMYTVDLNGIKYDFSWLEAGMCEVIGNIHDNPDLIGGVADAT